MASIDKKIEEKVNGGVRGIAATLNEYVEEDMKWKRANQEALDNMKNLTTTGGMLLRILLAIGALSGAWLAIKKTLNL